MLYPLSKSFSSTRLFVSGGVNSEPLKHRVWELDHAGSHQRALTLHTLLAEKKPYDTHLQLAKEHSDAIFQRDQATARAFKEHLRDMGERIDERNNEDRRNMRRRIHDYEITRGQSDADIHRGLTQRAKDFEAWKGEMSQRVKTSPPIWGGPPPRETEEREAERDALRRSVAADSRHYFEEQRAIKESLARRPPPTGPQRSQSSPAALEERRQANLTQLSKSGRDYEAFLEGTYDRHHVRIKEVVRKNQADHQVHLDFKEKALMAKSASIKDVNSRAKDDHAAMTQRIKERPKAHGGYKPLAKSNRRLREELAASSDLNATPSSATMRGGDDKDRTLSPRQMAASTS